MKYIQYYLDNANEADIQHGLTWYYEAHNKAKELALQYNVSLKIVSAIISALSPRCIWEQNIKDTESLLKCHCNGRKYHNIKVTTYGHNKQKAINLLKEVINPDTCFVTSKTYNFYNNILNPESNEYVTIDGHSINIYFGKIGVVKNKYFTKKFYDKIAKRYINVAVRHNIKPHQLQAITWLSFKRINNIKVNWRYYQQNLPF